MTAGFPGQNKQKHAITCKIKISQVHNPAYSSWYPLHTSQGHN